MSTEHKNAESKRPNFTIPLSDFAFEGWLGPNGHPVGYNKKGDKIEWLPPNEDFPHGEPVVLVRNPNEVAKAYNEFTEMLLWQVYQDECEEIKSGERQLTQAEKSTFFKEEKFAKRIEKKYGKENIGRGDFYSGLVDGRRSALAWVLGLKDDREFESSVVSWHAQECEV